MKKIMQILAAIFFISFFPVSPQAGDLSDYRYEETRVLVKLVKDASRLIETKGEVAFVEFKKPVSIWRHGDMYIFVLDTDGNMAAHPDAGLDGKNQLGLKDMNGKPVIQDIIREAAGSPGKSEGWSHYQWPKPQGGAIAWKTTFAKFALAPSGKKYIAASGLYDLKMEKVFLTSVVDAAVALVEKEGREAFAALRDKAGPFIFKDTYVFVDLPDGVELVNPAFPKMEGKNLMDYQDSAGNFMVREYINTALTKGAGWVSYMWPKPGQSTPSAKSTYVKKAVHDQEVFIIGSGEYFE